MSVLTLKIQTPDFIVDEITFEFNRFDISNLTYEGGEMSVDFAWNPYKGCALMEWVEWQMKIQQTFAYDARHSMDSMSSKEWKFDMQLIHDNLDGTGYTQNTVECHIKEVVHGDQNKDTKDTKSTLTIAVGKVLT